MFDPTDPHALVLAALCEELGLLDVAASPRGSIDQLEALERIKSAISATQARITDRLDEVDQTSSDRGKGAQVALARHESPHRGRELLTLSRALVHDLPLTMAALTRGDINERRAQLIANETRDLTWEDRRQVDTELAPHLRELGDRRLMDAVRRLVMRIDEAGATRRHERAAARRRVTGRLLTDGMAQISGVVSGFHYAAIMGSLHRRAAAEQARGDERSRDQIVADLFVARLTGQVAAVAVPVNLDVVVSAETLFGDGDEPADIPGFGPIPASVARRLALASPEQATRIRRLFRVDGTDHLVAMESNRRAFDGQLAEFIRLRDQICRTPWCNAPVRHLDHVVAAAAGGATTENNGQGLCEACNYAKQDPGWTQRTISVPCEPHVVETITPTGHVYRSRAPLVPRGERRWVNVSPGRWTLIA